MYCFVIGIFACTVGKICTPIFSFFLKNVVNIAILELGLVPNESPGKSTYYRGFLKFYAVITNSQKIP